jgi:hypothetical protein
MLGHLPLIKCFIPSLPMKQFHNYSFSNMGISVFVKNLAPLQPIMFDIGSEE